MCIPALAAIPAMFASAASAVGGAAAATGAAAMSAVGATTAAGAIASYAGLTGSILSTVGAIQQGQTQKAVGEYNAKMAERQATDERRRGSQAEADTRTRAKLFLGAQRAQMGGSGAVVDEGSFGDVLAQTAEFGERDAQTQRTNAERRAWGLEAEATNSRYQGSAAQSAGYVSGGASLLGGVGNFYRQKAYYEAWRTQDQKKPYWWENE